MARTALTVTVISRGGVTPPAPQAADSANGNSFGNTNSNVILEATNGDSAAHTVTVNFAETVDGQPVTARATPIAAGATMFFGPFSAGEYGDSVGVNVDSNLVTLRALQVS